MISPRRIAIVCDAVMPWNKGGREMILHQICRRLRRADQEVHIYTMNWWGGPAIIEREGVYFHGLCKFRPLYRGDRRSTAQALFFAFSVFKLLFEPFDVLHVDHMPFFPLYSARIVAWLRGRRMTAIWHEVWGRDYWFKYMRGPAGAIGYLTERISFSLPDAIASDCELTTARLRANGATCQIETVPLGVDAKAIAAVGHAEEQSDVIYVGRLISHKGVDLLVRAISRLEAERPNIRVLIIGTGPEEKRLIQMTASLDLSKNILFLGQIDANERVFALMKSSSVLALPSRREGFGLVALEANAAGIPVVTLRHPDNAAQALIREGVNGFLADESEDDLAAKIGLALSRKEALRPLEGLEAYDWEIVARRLERLWLPKEQPSASGK
ncbi:glycosyltransferase family 4 protein [Methylocystis sp. JR02]|uniref:glycosyltransferase family 4 protein n=1 Tax=Methylocystis sp. JR02 TaxID=3046284 RepID=UPI0024B8F885|nr:glycosyltransferase family 4 protein [Methylocystis sp. JR02]MDJ0450429.1 glycosyltransferase family 4 protein [Methylocystis sp. JR02]